MVQESALSYWVEDDMPVHVLRSVWGEINGRAGLVGVPDRVYSLQCHIFQFLHPRIRDTYVCFKVCCDHFIY